MTILGIETSSAVCSVGLANEFGSLSERSLVESHIHSEKLLTLIQDLCNGQKMELSQLDGVAVSIGPGSFTGLRIGLSTAKGLCFALNKPLIAVPTFPAFAVYAIMTHPEWSRVIVCIDAKQREYYIGVYEQDKGTVRETIALQLGSLSIVHAADSIKTAIITDRIENVKMEFHGSIIVEDVSSYSRGDNIAHMAMAKSKVVERVDWKLLEPMYLKDFVVRAQVKREK